MDKKTTFICVLIISIACNIVFFALWLQELSIKNTVPSLQQKYPLIGRRVFTNQYNGSNIIVNFLPLRTKLNRMIAPYKNNFALYFEYIPTGTSLGINEDVPFTAESLLKVPVVMAYFHKKERLDLVTDPTVSIKKTELNSQYGTLYKKGEGYKISLGDAAKLSLTESDNTASLLLADNISDDDFQYVYAGLDIPMQLSGNTPLITAVQYASILKSLYYSSVLNFDDSQKILSLMTQTKFKDLLPAGVPADTLVAHKIGLVDNQIYEDCGIVYVPERSYILCMVSQSDEKTARERMTAISKATYKAVTTIDR